jgi:hypothetical protein
VYIKRERDGKESGEYDEGSLLLSRRGGKLQERSCFLLWVFFFYKMKREGTWGGKKKKESLTGLTGFPSRQKGRSVYSILNLL